jgi:hypothetical protein
MGGTARPARVDTLGPKVWPNIASTKQRTTWIITIPKAKIDTKGQYQIKTNPGFFE